MAYMVLLQNTASGSFCFGVPAYNADPQYKEIKVEAFVNNGLAKSMQRGKAYLPESNETLSYTNSGNLSSDSRWNYAWNAKQRLASVETSQRAVSAGAPKVKYVYSYNWKGLKTKAEKYTWDTANSSWTLYCTNHRYYDDHNLIYERTVYASGVRDIYGNQMPETCNKYYYGIDLTGNVYASGGTGGIRMMNLNGKVAYPYNNATGNIEALFDDNGSLLAEYEYSPFGCIRCIRGSFADKNPMRFSSRYSEADTGLYYYSYRHYSPSLKKWLSHDPIGEQGALNLYNFVGNNPVLYVDILGLSNKKCECKLGEKRCYDRKLRSKPISPKQIQKLKDGKKLINSVNNWGALQSIGGVATGLVAKQTSGTLLQTSTIGIGGNNIPSGFIDFILSELASRHDENGFIVTAYVTIQTCKKGFWGLKWETNTEEHSFAFGKLVLLGNAKSEVNQRINEYCNQLSKP